MSINILMPALSPTMTQGTLARWLKKEGDAIRAGDVIAEIETDKATMEVEAVDEGVLGRILVGDGTEGVKVNQPIAVLDDGNGNAGDAAPAPPPRAEEKPAPKQEAGETGAPAQPSAAPPPRSAVANGKDHDGAGARVFASPLARRMAQQAGIDLSAMKGSGPNGRIVRADVEAARGEAPERTLPPKHESAVQAAPASPPRTAEPPARSTPINAPGKLVAFSNVKRVTARRLTEAKQTIPHFYVSTDIELDALLTLRGELNARSPKDGAAAFKLSVNDMLIKACAVTLRQVPGVNASFTDEGVFLYDDVDISVAVSIPGRADHADCAARGSQGAVRHQQREQGAVRAGEGGQAEAARSSRAAASRSPTWACMACAISPQSSIRRRRQSWR